MADPRQGLGGRGLARRSPPRRCGLRWAPPPQRPPRRSPPARGPRVAAAQPGCAGEQSRPLSTLAAHPWRAGRRPRPFLPPPTPGRGCAAAAGDLGPAGGRRGVCGGARRPHPPPAGRQQVPEAGRVSARWHACTQWSSPAGLGTRSGRRPAGPPPFCGACLGIPSLMGTHEAHARAGVERAMRVCACARVQALAPAAAGQRRGDLRGAAERAHHGSGSRGGRARAARSPAGARRAAGGAHGCAAGAGRGPSTGRRPGTSMPIRAPLLACRAARGKRCRAMPGWPRLPGPRGSPPARWLHSRRPALCWRRAPPVHPPAGQRDLRQQGRVCRPGGSALQLCSAAGARG